MYMCVYKRNRLHQLTRHRTIEIEREGQRHFAMFVLDDKDVRLATAQCHVGHGIAPSELIYLFMLQNSFEAPRW